MLLPLFEWLRELGMPGAAVMEYVTFRAAMAFMIALIITIEKSWPSEGEQKKNCNSTHG